jgi:hypothetical protein
MGIALFSGLWAQTGPSLHIFFEQLAASTTESTRPSADEVRAASESIENETSVEIERAMPAIVRCVGHYDDQVKGYGAIALFAIARRRDGGSLINPHARVIGQLLNLPEERFQRFAGLIFVNLRPVPVKEVVPEFLAYIKRTDSGAKIQPAIAGTLVLYAPNEPDVLETVTQFMLRPASKSTRIDTLNAVFRPDFRYDPIIGIVVAALGDPDIEVRSAAIRGLSSMGKYALGVAFLKLQKMAGDANEPDSVRSAAEEALKIYGAPR